MIIQLATGYDFMKFSKNVILFVFLEIKYEWIQLKIK